MEEAELSQRARPMMQSVNALVVLIHVELGALAELKSKVVRGGRGTEYGGQAAEHVSVFACWL